MELISLIKKIIMNPHWINPIFDDVIYEDRQESYSGGSLSNSNLLLVFSEILQCEKNKIVQFISNSENCEVVMTSENAFDCAIEDALKTIGHFEHIINCIDVNNEEDVYRLYSLLQKESGYLLNRNYYGTICTVVVSDEYNNCILHGVKSLIEGCGWVMPNHKIISNGILTTREVMMNEVMRSALFLSSKYGQLLTGNIIELGRKQ